MVVLVIVLEEVELTDELDDWVEETEIAEDGDVFFQLKIRASHDVAGGVVEVEEEVAEVAVEEAAMDDGDVVAAESGDGGICAPVDEPTKSLAANA